MSIQTHSGQTGEVDYVKAKQNFLMFAEMLIKHPKYGKFCKFFTTENLESIIDEKVLNPDQDQYEKYIVLEVNGRTRLMEKRKSKPLAECLSWSNMFDLFMPLHVQGGHRDWPSLAKQIKAMMKEYDVEYKYPRVALSLLQKACNICSLNKRNQRHQKVCSVFVIPMITQRADEKFKYLLIYSHNETQFIVLRPLMQKTDKEISLELYKIFMQFGPPNVIEMHGYNMILAKDVQKLLEQLCPNFKIEIIHEKIKYELPTIVTDRIEEWMERTKKPNWELGCYIVQSELNNSGLLKPGLLDLTPYDLQFHTNSNDILLENILADNNLNVSATEIFMDPITYKDTSQSKTRKENNNKNKTDTLIKPHGNKQDIINNTKQAIPNNTKQAKTSNTKQAITNNTKQAITNNTKQVITNNTKKDMESSQNTNNSFINAFRRYVDHIQASETRNRISQKSDKSPLFNVYVNQTINQNQVTQNNVNQTQVGVHDMNINNIQINNQITNNFSPKVPEFMPAYNEIDNMSNTSVIQSNNPIIRNINSSHISNDNIIYTQEGVVNPVVQQGLLQYNINNTHTEMIQNQVNTNPQNVLQPCNQIQPILLPAQSAGQNQLTNNIYYYINNNTGLAQYFNTDSNRVQNVMQNQINQDSFVALDNRFLVVPVLLTNTNEVNATTKVNSTTKTKRTKTKTKTTKTKTINTAMDQSSSMNM